MRAPARRAARVTPVLVLAAFALAGCGVIAPPTIVGQPSTSINVPLQVVACTTRDVCAAFGTSLLPVGPTSTAEFRRASGVWAPLRTPAAARSYVSTAACGPATCLVAGVGPGGDLLWRFRASPPRVSALAAPPAGTEVQAVACLASTCTVIDSAGSGNPLRYLTTSDGGSTWSAPVAIPGTIGWRATSLACPSAGACLLALAAENAPADTPPAPRLIATVDGALTWSARALPGAWFGLSSLACRVSGCDAVATSDRGTLWATSGRLGRRWRARAVGASVNSLACTTEGRCVLVGTTPRGPWAASTDGSTLRVATLRYVPTVLTSAACGSRVCALASNSTVASVRP